MGTDPQTPPSNLLRLPVELRLQIYTYLLQLPLPEPTRSGSPPSIHALSKPSSKSVPNIHPSILLTSRQINDEATPLLYAQNTFLAHPSILTSFPRLRPWLPPLKEPSVIGMIRRFHLVIRLDADVPFSPEEAARSLSGLEELSVEATQRYFMECDTKSLRALEAVRAVKRVVIFGTFREGEKVYVEWLRGAMMSRPGQMVRPFTEEAGQGLGLERASLQGALVAA